MNGKLRGRRQGRSDIIIAILAFWLCISTTVLPVNAAGKQEEIISLYRGNAEENIPFQLTNMFPGDSKTQYYRVRVSYTGTITVSFQATVREGDEKLAEALKAEVRLVNTDQVLYEGTIADMPEIDYVLTTDNDSQRDALCYEITVGLGTDAGNEYQNLSMTADLFWWAEGSGSQDEPTSPGDEEKPSGGDEPMLPEGGDETSSSEAGSLTDPPITGDNSHVMMWMVCFIVGLAVLICVLMEYRRKQRMLRYTTVLGENNQAEQCEPGAAERSRKRLLMGMFLVVFLVFGLAVTSFALVYQKVAVEDNLFETGIVSINLNDGKPIITEEELLFEPGMTVVKDFFLENNSTGDVYYKLYFANIEGDMSEVLEVTVKDDDRILYNGILSELIPENMEAADDLLREGEKRELAIWFHLPEEIESEIENCKVSFDINADAVQAVNNLDRQFD